MAKYSLLTYTMHFWTGTSEVFFNKVLKKDIHPRLNILYILQSIGYILKNDLCTFDNECFLLTQGTAMTTNFASTCANISMRYPETKLYNIVDLKGK